MEPGPPLWEGSDEPPLSYGTAFLSTKINLICIYQYSL
jgi:hypothetical protein